MSDDLLRTLADEREIEQLMYRYIDRVDANDPEGAAGCFAEDGIGVYWGEYRGQVAIAERLGTILDAFSATSHHLSNLMVRLEGDRATAQSYVYAFHRTVGAHEQLHVWGRWIDELVRRPQGWRFARREVRLVGRVGSHPSSIEEDRNLVGHPGRLIR